MVLGLPAKNTTYKNNSFIIYIFSQIINNVEAGLPKKSWSTSPYTLQNEKNLQHFCPT